MIMIKFKGTIWKIYLNKKCNSDFIGTVHTLSYATQIYFSTRTTLIKGTY